MQTALTGAELTLLGEQNHRAKAYLGVLAPTAAFKALVNDSDIAQGEMTITYDNVSTGAFGDIVAGHTLLVGTAEGLYDLGRVRVKAADATTIDVATNSDVVWEDDAHLTVVDNFEYWVMFSRLVLAGDTVTYYWDYDEGFQAGNLPPMPIMGPPAPVFIADGGVVKFFGDQSYPVTGISIDAYSWVFDGGAPGTKNTAGTESVPHEITYSTPGIYWASLEIDDDDGQVATGRRPVMVYDRTGADAPYTDFEVTSLRGDTADGGWEMTIKVYGDATPSDFPAQAMVVLFTDEWYGDTAQHIGGYPYREHVRFVGQIEEDTTIVQFDPKSGERYITFKARTWQGVMKSREDFPQTLEDNSPAYYWPELTDLTAKKAAYHLMRFQSTILNITDVYLPDTDLALKSQDFPLGSVYRQIRDYLSSALFAQALCDKQGSLYLDFDPNYLVEADRAGVVEVLDATDYLREKLQVPHSQVGSTRHVELQGMYYDAASRNATPIIAQAPGNAPRQEGSAKTIKGLILGPQADANELAGVALAEENNSFTDLPFLFAGNHWYHDIAQPAYFLHTLLLSQNDRGLEWTDEHFIPRTVDVKLDNETGVVTVDVTADRENDPCLGITGIYPTEPPEEPPPNPPGPPQPPLPPEPEELPGHIVTFGMECGCNWSTDEGASWEARNNGLPDPLHVDMYDGMIKRGWQTIQGTADPESCILVACGLGFVDISYDAGKTWIDITPGMVDVPDGMGGTCTPTGVICMMLECPNDASDTFYVLMTTVASGDGWLGRTQDMGLTWTVVQVGGYHSTSEWIRPMNYVGRTGPGTSTAGGNCPGCPSTVTITDPQALCFEDGETIIEWEVPWNACSGGGWDLYGGCYYDFWWSFGGGLVTAATRTPWPPGDSGVNFFVHGDIESPGWSGFDDASAWANIMDPSKVQLGIGAGRNLHTGEPFATGAWDWGESKWNTYPNPWYPPILEGYMAGAGTFTENSDVQYLRIRVALKSDTLPITGRLTLTNAQLKIAGLAYNIVPTGLAVDFSDGSKVYVTYQDIVLGGFLAPEGLGMLEHFDGAAEDEDFWEPQVILPMHSTHADCYVSYAVPRVVWNPTIDGWNKWVAIFGRQNGLMFTAESGHQYCFLTTSPDTLIMPGGELPWDDRHQAIEDDPAADTTTGFISALLAAGDASGQYDRNSAFSRAVAPLLGIYHDDGLWNDWKISDAVGDWPFVVPATGLGVCIPGIHGVSVAYDAKMTALLVNSSGVGAVWKVAYPYSEYGLATNITNDHTPTAVGIMKVEWVTP